MVLRAIIVDDEQKGIDTLKILIELFIQDVKVVAESTAAGASIELIENYKPEIVFLDINMPEMSGFDLLEKLQWRDFNLVFTTAHQEYALRALKNNAIDYLLKPIDHEDLKLTVERIQTKLTQDLTETARFNYYELLENRHQKQKQRILINSRTGVEYIDINDIVFLESQSNYTKIALKNNREILSSKTLKEFETQLCTEHSFMRIHHSFIINLKRVSRYLKTEELVVMDDEQKIPLAKSRKDDFYIWLEI